MELNNVNKSELIENINTVMLVIQKDRQLEATVDDRLQFVLFLPDPL